MVAYSLSRVTHQKEDNFMDNYLLDEHLFALITRTPWFVFADIAKYLVASKLPNIFTSKEKLRLIRKSASFSWIGGYLFRFELDNVLRRCVKEDETFDIL